MGWINGGYVNDNLKVMTSRIIYVFCVHTYMHIFLQCYLNCVLIGYMYIRTYIRILHTYFTVIFFALHTVPTPTVTISPSGPIQGAMVGSYQVINCTVSTVSGVESSSVMISWMGPGGVITNNSRVTISPTTSSGNTYTSSLQFTYLMEGVEGTYTCNVMILETTGSQSVELLSLTST